MDHLFDLASVPWQPVRPDVASGVYGRALLDGQVKAVLTRVEPGGRFLSHTDAYAHLFYFLSGEGALWVGGDETAIRPGLVARIEAGVAHAYENRGPEDLLLLSMNLPVG
jgi:quercetin dioxygenase-like cupin family protein